MTFTKFIKFTFLITTIFLLYTCGNSSMEPAKEKPVPVIGEVIDELNGVKIYYNGNPRNTFGRSKSETGYNFGLRWQCVEFIKRYYFEYLNHEMPNTWGHAKDFIDLNLMSSQFNKKRGLYQFRNRSISPPKINDILVFGGNALNRYGHIAIISNIDKNVVEIVQQNTGRISRERLRLSFNNKKWVIENPEILGWLGKR